MARLWISVVRFKPAARMAFFHACAGQTRAGKGGTRGVGGVGGGGGRVLPPGPTRLWLPGCARHFPGPRSAACTRS